MSLWWGQGLRHSFNENGDTQKPKQNNKHKEGGERVTDAVKPASSGPGAGFLCVLRSHWKCVDVCLCAFHWL